MWNQGKTSWKKGHINVEPRENKVEKGANKCGTKGKNRQVAALTLTPRRVRRASGAVEESDREGGRALVGERVWKLEPVVGG